MMDPKVLRAEAKKLLTLARSIEMAQNPQKAMKKKLNQQVAGMKRKAKNDLFQTLSGKK